MIGHGWKSGTDQSMLIWKLTLYKVTLRHTNVSFWAYFHDTMAEGSLPSIAPSLGKQAPVDEDEPEVDPAGVINKREAAYHHQLITDAVQDFTWRIKDGEIQDVLKQLIEEVQMVIKWVFPSIAKANAITILRSIPNCTCTALRDRSEEHEQYLEDIMPDEDIPEGEKIVADVSQVKALTYDQKELIVSLFDNLSITHEHLGRAAANMSSLCKVMEPDQLLLIMKCSVRPLVQLSASQGCLMSQLKSGKRSCQTTRQKGEGHYDTKGRCKKSCNKYPTTPWYDYWQP